MRRHRRPCDGRRSAACAPSGADLADPGGDGKRKNKTDYLLIGYRVTKNTLAVMPNEKHVMQKNRNLIIFKIFNNSFFPEDEALKTFKTDNTFPIKNAQRAREIR